MARRWRVRLFRPCYARRRNSAARTRSRNCSGVSGGVGGSWAGFGVTTADAAASNGRYYCAFCRSEAHHRIRAPGRAQPAVRAFTLVRGDFMPTIVFATSKGGAGKSTTGVLLATELAGQAAASAPLLAALVAVRPPLADIVLQARLRHDRRDTLRWGARRSADSMQSQCSVTDHMSLQ
jgi:hypothetical protein